MKVLAVYYKYYYKYILHPIKIKNIINIHTILLNNNNNNIHDTINNNKLYYITSYNNNINENNLSKYIIYI